jgi:Arc/MetJ-type ribon-helix-helix transcriptional regulator
MKKKISISIEESTIDEIQSIVSEGTFRSNSHLFELAVNKMLKEMRK